MKANSQEQRCLALRYDNNVSYCGFKVRRAGVIRLCQLLTMLRTLHVIISSLNTIKTAHILVWLTSSLY